jgi:hypothetical protein
VWLGSFALLVVLAQVVEGRLFEWALLLAQGRLWLLTPVGALLTLTLTLAQADGPLDVVSPERLFRGEAIVGLTEHAEIFGVIPTVARAWLDVIELEKPACRTASTLGVDESALLAVPREDFTPCRPGNSTGFRRTGATGNGISNGRRFRLSDPETDHKAKH